MDMVKLGLKLADMAELEQIRAFAADEAADTLKGGAQAIKLNERDRHTARAGAFIEAARLCQREQGK